MCIKLISGDLNPDFYPSHSTNIYTCGVIIALRVRGGALYLKFITHTLENFDPYQFIILITHYIILLPMRKCNSSGQ